MEKAQLDQTLRIKSSRIDKLLRLQPLTSTFQKVERLAFDLSRGLNKDLNFVKMGHLTEIDKDINERVKDPLIHIIRNAVDHGIESASERISIGKEAKATIHIQAIKKIHGVDIVISDDGRGLDRNLIVQKAQLKNLIVDGNQLSDEDVYNLITYPGKGHNSDVEDRYLIFRVALDLYAIPLRLIGRFPQSNFEAEVLTRWANANLYLGDDEKKLVGNSRRPVAYLRWKD